MSERPTMSDGSPFDPTDSVHVAERLSVVATERDRLAARLAEVEGQARLSNARAMELEAERDEARRRLAEVEAERDRLAQELEDAVEAMRKAARGPSPASAVTGFLARFPVEEGSHGR